MTPAEREVIGRVLLFPDSSATALRRIELGDFTTGAGSAIWAAIVAVADRGEEPHVAAVGAELIASGQAKAIGGVAALGKLTSAVTTGADLGWWVRRLIEESAERRFTGALGAVLAARSESLAHRAEAAREAAESARSSLRDEAPLMVGDGLDEILDRLATGEEPPGVIRTGFSDLDAVLGGWQPGVLSVIGARPAAGKSVFMLNAALAAARAGKRVLLFSLEDTLGMAQRRLLSRLSGVTLAKIISQCVPPCDVPALRDAADELSDLPIEIIEQARDSREIRAVAEQRRPDLLIVDYLSYLSDGGPKLSAFESQSLAVRGLAVTAKALGVPVLLASQLNRAAEARADHAPMLGDLRQTGETEQVARLVILLHRPELHSDAPEHRGQLLAIVAKSSHGPTGTVPLSCDMARMTITDWRNGNDY